MHPEIVRNAPGACPICGMMLEPRTAIAAEGEESHALRDMKRRFWFAAAVTVPLVLLAIAMETGTDVAMESASVTLVKGDLRGIVRARRLSRKTMRNIKQNLFFAFFYNTAGVPVAAGVLYPFFGLLSRGPGGIAATTTVTATTEVAGTGGGLPRRARARATTATRGPTEARRARTAAAT